MCRDKAISVQDGPWLDDLGEKRLHRSHNYVGHNYIDHNLGWMTLGINDYIEAITIWAITI